MSPVSSKSPVEEYDQLSWVVGRGWKSWVLKERIFPVFFDNFVCQIFTLAHAPNIILISAQRCKRGNGRMRKNSFDATTWRGSWVVGVGVGKSCE